MARRTVVRSVRALVSRRSGAAVQRGRYGSAVARRPGSNVRGANSFVYFWRAQGRIPELPWRVVHRNIVGYWPSSSRSTMGLNGGPDLRYRGGLQVRGCSRGDVQGVPRLDVQGPARAPRGGAGGDQPARRLQSGRDGGVRGAG